MEDDDSESVRDAEVAVGALLSLGAGGPVEGQDIVGRGELRFLAKNYFFRNHIFVGTEEVSLPLSSKFVLS